MNESQKKTSPCASLTIMAPGIAIGVAVGVALHDVAVGIAIGVGLAFAFNATRQTKKP